MHIINFQFWFGSPCFRTFFERIKSWYQIISSLYKGSKFFFIMKSYFMCLVVILEGSERPCSNFLLRISVFSTKSYKWQRFVNLKNFYPLLYSCIFFVNAMNRQSLYFIFSNPPLRKNQDNNHSLLQIFTHSWGNCVKWLKLL